MDVQEIYYRELRSPIGPLLLVSTDHGLCSVEFGSYEDVKEQLSKWCDRRLHSNRLVENASVHEQAAAQLQQYFAGERQTFELKLDLQGTEFQKKVWDALLNIPYGKTKSYKEVGVDIGAVKAVRAIGGANNRNPIPIIVPCHRVIGADGSLVGYGGGTHIKSYLLELESGIK